jgi:hypothetical protein
MMEVLMPLYIIALMYRATKANAVELSECFAQVNHDGFTRLLVKRCCWQKLLWQRFAQHLIKPGGWLEIDDTVLDKFGARIFGVSWVYSSRQQRVVQGLNVVVLLWTDGQRRVPVGLKLWRKGDPTKIVLAARLLRWAKRLGLQPDYVVMDSWYSAKRLLKQIRSYQWHFVTRLKKNRKFKDKKLGAHWPHRFGHATGALVGGITVLVVKDGRRYLQLGQACECRKAAIERNQSPRMDGCAANALEFRLPTPRGGLRAVVAKLSLLTCGAITARQLLTGARLSKAHCILAATTKDRNSFLIHAAHFGMNCLATINRRLHLWAIIKFDHHRYHCCVSVALVFGMAELYLKYS